MAIKTSLNYSPNFDPKKRKANQIKFLIFHYTGMRTENAAIKRLTDIKSEVSSHYFIKQTGQVITLVPDLYVAWHAGRSKWKKYESLNKNSIGIEITNPGHSFGYKKFPKQQILSLIKLTKFLISKYRINKKNILGHSDIAPERKKDPGEKFPWKHLSKSFDQYCANIQLFFLTNIPMETFHQDLFFFQAQYQNVLKYFFY